MWEDRWLIYQKSNWTRARLQEEHNKWEEDIGLPARARLFCGKRAALGLQEKVEGVQRIHLRRLWHSSAGEGCEGVLVVQQGGPANILPNARGIQESEDAGATCKGYDIAPRWHHEPERSRALEHTWGASGSWLYDTESQEVAWASRYRHESRSVTAPQILFPTSEGRQRRQVLLRFLEWKPETSGVGWNGVRQQVGSRRAANEAQ